MLEHIVSFVSHNPCMRNTWIYSVDTIDLEKSFLNNETEISPSLHSTI